MTMARYCPVVGAVSNVTVMVLLPIGAHETGTTDSSVLESRKTAIRSSVPRLWVTVASAPVVGTTATLTLRGRLSRSDHWT